MRRRSALLFALAWALPHVTAAADRPTLSTVSALDVDRYAGLWYEIARYPNRFQRQCAGDVSARYRRLPDGTVEVVNACRTQDGSREEAVGVARPVVANDFTRLQVRFAPALLSFLPFVWGNYWVIDLAADYSYAVIGEPSREYLWVLARSPSMDDVLLDWLLQRAAAQGYDPGRAVRTLQTLGPRPLRPE